MLSVGYFSARARECICKVRQSDSLPCIRVQIPLHLGIRTASDDGAPIVAQEPLAPVAQAYRAAADRIWIQLEQATHHAPIIRTE